LSTGLHFTPVKMSAWNRPASTGFPSSTSWRRSCLVTLAHPKYTKPQKGNKTDRKDAKWICDLFMCEMIKPSFIPPADIRHLRDLARYRVKLTCMSRPAKKTVRKTASPSPTSNLMMSSPMSLVNLPRSITEHILAHPGEHFDVTPFRGWKMQNPIEEIQAAVDGAVSPWSRLSNSNNASTTSMNSRNRTAEMRKGNRFVSLIHAEKP
jgi:hypothetical protein